MRKFFSVFATALLIASAALALDLADAKGKGLVGETPTGYLGVVTASPEAQALAADVNARRKAEYQKVAAKNGQTLGVVEKLAGVKAIEMTKPGNYVMDAAGKWMKK